MKRQSKKETKRKIAEQMKKSSESVKMMPGAVNPQKGIFKSQTGDISSKRIFENHILAAQFLRDYSGIEELKDIRAEEIETVKLRYHLFDETEMNPDSAVRVLRTKKEGEVPVYIIPLIDHKSAVDYNVSVQLFYYIACIWRDWEKEMKNLGFDCRSKDFHYPMVFPVVYYEGTARWTAGRHLIDRIRPIDALKQYTPDFMYHVVSAHAHTNEELLAKKDEMSVAMLFSRIQTSEDVETLRKVDFNKIDGIIAEADPEVLGIIAGIVQSLCRRMNVPEKETREYTERIRGEKSMGYLFENMEKMDIQAERRNTEKERKRADEEKKRADEEKKRADEAEKRADKAIAAAILSISEFTSDRAKAKASIMKQFDLEDKYTEKMFERYWDKNS